MKLLNLAKHSRLLKSSIASLLVVEMLVVSAAPALAITNVGFSARYLNPVKPDEFMEVIMDELGISSGAAKNVGQAMNVSDNKMDGPEVRIFFTPTDPKEGEKLEAHAMPMYFKTDAKDMYYTWYLKHKGCDINNSPSREVKEKCDKDNDEEITENDWKIEAMRLLAQGDYDTTSENFEGSVGDDDKDKDGFPQPDDEHYPSGKDAKLGGAKGFEFTDLNKKKCYIYDFAKGTAYELINGRVNNDSRANPIETVDGYTAECRSINGESRIAACVESSQAIGLNDTGDVCAIESQFSSSTALSEHISDQTCAKDGLNYQCNYEYTFYNEIEDSSGNGDTGDDDNQPSCTGGKLICPKGQTAVCIKLDDAIEEVVGDETSLDGFDFDGSNDTCATYNSEFNDAYSTECITNCEEACALGDVACTDACATSEECESIGTDIEDISCEEVTSDHKVDNNAECHHLFPKYNDFIGTIQMGDARTMDADLTGEEVGDGTFTKDEELFWNTNPKDADSSDTGFFDEAIVAGVGQAEFSWIYETGDKIGVAVEGESIIPTKYADNSNMIMWALPNNKCNVKNINKKTEKIKGFDVTIFTTLVNIDDCLEDNLVDPIAEGQAKKLDVEVTYTPDNPLNDPSEAKGGDRLNLNAIVTNSPSQPNKFKYTWRVYLMDDGLMNGTPIEFTEDLMKSELIEGTNKGINLSNLKLFLNLNEKTLGDLSPDEFNQYFPKGAGYIKAVVDVEEGMGLNSGNDEQIRKGKGSVVIKVVSTDKKISAYSVDVTSEGLIKTNDDQICQGDSPLCYVAKNDIVAVKIPGVASDMLDYRWTLNDNPIVCDANISPDCVGVGGEATNLTIFPIIGEVGDDYTLRAVAKDTKSLKNIELVKTFRIVEPYLEIAPNEDSEVSRKVMGAYVDLDGVYHDDKSNTVLQVEEGKEIDLQLVFHPESYEKYSQVAWALDGAIKDEVTVEDAGYQRDGKFRLVFENDINMKPAGTSYNVEASAVYTQPTAVRKALKKHWDVSEYATAEDDLMQTIKIEVIPGTETYGAVSTKNMMASLVRNASGYVLFLVKILLSAGLVLFSTGVMFALTPGNQASREYRRYE